MKALFAPTLVVLDIGTVKFWDVEKKCGGVVEDETQEIIGVSPADLVFKAKDEKRPWLVPGQRVRFELAPDTNFRDGRMKAVHVTQISGLPLPSGVVTKRMRTIGNVPPQQQQQQQSQNGSDEKNDKSISLSSSRLDSGAEAKSEKDAAESSSGDNFSNEKNQRQQQKRMFLQPGMKSVPGVVTRWSHKTGCGLIHSDASSWDLFVHCTGLAEPEVCTLTPGDEVVFDTKAAMPLSVRRTYACNVRVTTKATSADALIGQKNVNGSVQHVSRTDGLVVFVRPDGRYSGIVCSHFPGNLVPVLRFGLRVQFDVEKSRYEDTKAVASNLRLLDDAMAPITKESSVEAADK